MSTASKLNRILTTKSDLKTALVNKGQDVTDETPFKNYASYIGNLTDTSDATATGHDLLQGKFAYSKGVKIGGGITYIEAGASAKVNAQSEYVSNYTSKQCIEKEEQPRHIIAFEQGATVITDISYSDIVRVTGLTADIIKKDITILGVTGSYEGTDTSDATAVAGDLAKDKTAYVNGQKITGTIASGSPVLEGTDVIYSPILRALGGLYTFNKDSLYRTGTQIDVSMGEADVASAISLTANKIAQGQTVLGVTGTYDGGVSAALSASY